MRRARRPTQTFFQIKIRGTEDALPDASQLAAFVDAYNRLYTILRIATDPNYDVEVLKHGYRLRNRDKLRVRSFKMASPFQAEFLLVAFPEVITAIKWLAPICIDIYKTKRDGPKVQAETAKIQAEAYKTLAEGRKADAEARKADAETEQILQNLALVPVEKQHLNNSLIASNNSANLPLESAKKVTEEISQTLSLDKMPGNLEEILTESLPPQARLPLSRALTDMIKSSFVIVYVEVGATRIADGDDTQKSKE